MNIKYLVAFFISISSCVQEGIISRSNDYIQKESPYIKQEVFVEKYDTTKIIKHYNSNEKLIYYEYLYSDSIIQAVYISSGTSKNRLLEGEILFDEYCNSCHKIKSPLVGPGLWGKDFKMAELQIHKKYIYDEFSFLDSIDIENIKLFINNN